RLSARRLGAPKGVACQARLPALAATGTGGLGSRASAALRWFQRDQSASGKAVPSCQYSISTLCCSAPVQLAPTSHCEAPPSVACCHGFATAGALPAAGA